MALDSSGQPGSQGLTDRQENPSQPNYLENPAEDEDMNRLATAREERLWMGLDQSLQGWSRSLELGGKEPEGHGYRVAEMSMLFAKKLGLPSEQIVDIVRGALLHDIGKLAIPDEILHKNGPLTPAERALVEQHPTLAKNLLEPIEILQSATDIPYCHHERWDGKGYPRGLKGQEIPLAARVFAIVDVWDVLSYDQPYREAWPADQVLEHITAGKGTHFDPDLVDPFLMLVADIDPKAVAIAADDPAHIVSSLRLASA